MNDLTLIIPAKNESESLPYIIDSLNYLKCKIKVSLKIDDVATINSIKNKNVEILWASTREPYNYIQAKQLKCNIITMPPKIINKISDFGESQLSMTISTVKGFLSDSRKSKFKI